MDAGDLIYFLILGVFLLGGLFKRKKKDEKRKELESTYSESVVTEKVENFDDWFYKEEKKEIEEEVTPVYEEVIIKKEEPFQKIEKQIRIKNNFAPKEEKEPELPELVVELDSVEEARKAFVYSEIFQRKY